MANQERLLHSDSDLVVKMADLPESASAPTKSPQEPEARTATSHSNPIFPSNDFDLSDVTSFLFYRQENGKYRCHLCNRPYFNLRTEAPLLINIKKFHSHFYCEVCNKFVLNSELHAELVHLPSGDGICQSRSAERGGY